jgi:hypothetical protein
MRAGDTVQLIGAKRTAKIIRLLKSAPGGVLLNKRLGGFRCWHREALKVIHGR